MIRFLDDPAGAMLEFADLAMREVGPREWEAWKQLNAPKYPMEIRGPAAMTKGYFSQIIQSRSVGEENERLRRLVDQTWLALDSKQLLATWSGDQSNESTYRVLSELGRSLLSEDAYREYLGGMAETARRKRQSVVKIYAEGKSGIGSGFIIDGPRVLTAAHVLELVGPEFVIETETGVKLAYEAIRRDEDADLAIVTLRNDGSSPSPLRLGQGPELLDEVVILGYPPLPQTADAFLVANRGEVSALPDHYDGRPLIVVSCLLRGGNSGGPVFNRRGQVIGVVTRRLFAKPADETETLLEGLGYAAAVPVSAIQRFLSGP